MKDQYTYDDNDDILDTGDFIYADLYDEEEDFTSRPRTSKQRIEDYLENRRLKDMIDDDYLMDDYM